MTKPQPDDDSSYPAHWGYHDSGHRSSDDPIAGSPIAGMSSGMGYADDHQSPHPDAFPPHWRI